MSKLTNQHLSIRVLLAAFGFVGAIVVLASCTHKPVRTMPPLLNAWLEMVPEDRISVRAIVDASSCPSVMSEGVEIPMQVRAAASQAFPVLSCELRLPATVREVNVAGTRLVNHGRDAQRILVIGDTGCRIKKYPDGKMAIQLCAEPSAWPLSSIIKNAAGWTPDLIVHVGDYHYREATCPPNEPSCAGTISGDNWESWRDDFFGPTAPLLAVAPWVFVRGNHEDCQRAGEGWFRFLAGGEVPAKCQDATPPYRVAMANNDLEVIDDAVATNLPPSLAQIKSGKGTPLWLLGHRPFLTDRADTTVEHQASLPKELLAPGAVSLAICGHVHTSSINRFADQRPPEIIAGNSGTSLDQYISFTGVKGIAAEAFADFGYLTMEQSKPGRWLLRVRDRAGKQIHECEMIEKRGAKTTITCSPEKIHQSVGM